MLGHLEENSNLRDLLAGCFHGTDFLMFSCQFPGFLLFFGLYILCFFLSFCSQGKGFGFLLLAVVYKMSIGTSLVILATFKANYVHQFIFNFALRNFEGLKETELKANLILCCMRGEGNDAQNEETIELASKYLVEDGGVVAVDLAGAEALYPTENYRELFEKAKELDIPFVIHAGEAAGAESVRYAVEFGARRIGHGVRIFEDPEVVALVKEKGVTLEMCPTSNVQTQAIDNLLEYPFMMYLDEGIKVTLNTDDMAIERTTLANEFRIMEEYFNLRPEQERILLANAVDAGFTTDAVKNQLREILGLDAVIQSNAA